MIVGLRDHEGSNGVSGPNDDIEVENVVLRSLRPFDFPWKKTESVEVNS